TTVTAHGWCDPRLASNLANRLTNAAQKRDETADPAAARSDCNAAAFFEFAQKPGGQDFLADIVLWIRDMFGRKRLSHARQPGSCAFGHFKFVWHGNPLSPPSSNLDHDKSNDTPPQ